MTSTAERRKTRVASRRHARTGTPRPRPSATTRNRVQRPSRRLASRTRKSAKPLSSGPFMMLLMITVCLSLLGLTMVLSASSVMSLTTTGSPWGQFRAQVAWLGLGIIAMTTMALVDHNHLRKLTLPALIGSIVLLVGVLTPLGVSVNGAQRWIDLGPLQFQPSEIAKFTLVLYAAHVLSSEKDVSLKRAVRPILVVLVLYGALILLQPNLGTAIIMFSIGIATLYASGVRLWVLAILGSTTVVGASALAYFAEYRRARLLAFLDPWADPLDEGWQTIQSLVSVANGGVTGVGIGASRGKFGFLPEAQNDFIFAVTAEEFGLVGATVVIFGYVLFGLTALVVARRADRFGALLVVGVATWVTVQAFINIGAVLGVIPIAGVPLPLMSAGGTALVSTLAGIGVMLNVARTSR